jgi:hypothetical protein
MTIKIFEAKMTGKCAKCGKELLGKRVLYNREKQLVHADCEFPDKIKAANASPREGVRPISNPPTQSTAPPSTPVFNMGAEIRVNADLFHRAREIVDKEFESETKDYSLYQVSIAAVFTALSKKRELVEKAATWTDKKW